MNVGMSFSTRTWESIRAGSSSQPSVIPWSSKAWLTAATSAAVAMACVSRSVAAWTTACRPSSKSVVGV
jgi:Tfp pilus assembly protein PilV